MKISALENLVYELVSRGCDKAKASFLVEEFKKEINEKKRRRNFLNFGKTREPTAREMQNATLTAFRAEINAIYGDGQDQPQNSGSLAASVNQLFPPASGAGDSAGNAKSPHIDILPISRKRPKRDLLAPDGNADQL